LRVENSGATGGAWGTLTQLWNLDNINGQNPLLPMDTANYRDAFATSHASIRAYRSVFLTSPLLNLFNVRYVISSGVDGPSAAITVLDTKASEDQFHLVFSDFYHVFENRSALPRAFVVPTTRFVADRAQILADLSSGAVDPRTTALVEQADIGAAGQPSSDDAVSGDQPDQARYESVDVNHVRVRVSGHAGFLVVLDPYWSDWITTVDGKSVPMYRADYLFRGLPVPAGEHTVEMTYAPASVRGGAIISAFGVILVLLAVAWPWLRGYPARRR
jgi:hypothetical protein